MIDTAGWIAVAVTAFAVICCVMLHYEAMVSMTSVLRFLGAMHRRRMLILVFVLLLVHVAEIWIFSLAYFVLIHLVGAGHILGHDMANFFDYVYFSAVVYSTVGFGDLYPVGAVRFLAGTEALAGFVLLTWSASFVFLEMQRFWKNS